MKLRSKTKHAGRLHLKPVLAGGLALAWALPQTASGQANASLPDAQVEANVLKALAAAPELSAQDVQSSTVYGIVTLSGTVQTETLRSRAENLAARAPGVKKVVDELTLGTPKEAANTVPAPDNNAPGDEGGQVLQSDGTYAPSQPATPYNGAPPQPAPANPGQTAGNGQPYPQAPYGQPQQVPYPQAAPYGQPPANYPPQQGYGQPYPPNAYGQAPQGYAPPPAYAPQGGQEAGVAVTVPSGALLRVRINRGLDSNHIKPGTPFDGTVLSDVAAGGLIAIPRGATVQGVVVDSKKSGALKGEGELSLQIDNVTLSGTVYPVTSDVWERQGTDKSVRTVNSAVGLGLLGAIVGGVAGGGAGAAVGAGVGAGAGVAGSAASPGGRVIVPPEAVLTFHLAQPAPVRTVSEQEMQRLAYAAGPGPGAPPVVRRRYYPGYYAPAPYPYPY